MYSLRYTPSLAAAALCFLAIGCGNAGRAGARLHEPV